MTAGRPSAPERTGLKVWLLAVAAASAAGWILSAFGALHATGYLVAALLLGMGLWMAGRRAGWRFRPPHRHWRGTLPRLYLILAGCAAVGGFGHAPSNYDTLWYRIPRTYHWLAEHRWHWIHSIDVRLNCLANGYEWLQAPLLLLPGGERLLFLPSLISFLLLPGVVFGAFTRLGVSPRVAARWMWLVPAGWVFALQAGSATTDAWSAVFVLASIEFALRARRTGRPGDVLWSVLAVALLTNTKQVNVAAVLPWAVAVLPSLGLLRKAPGATLATVVAATLVSVAPITIANFLHTGTWLGWQPEERDFVPSNPAFALAANAIILTVLNFLPPFALGVDAWNDWITTRAAGAWGDWTRGFESFGQLPGTAGDNSAGLGPLLILLLLVSMWMARRTGWWGPGDRIQRGVWTGGAVVTAVLLAKLGCRELARYFAPVYPLLLGFWLTAPGHREVVRRRRWRRLAAATLLATIAVVASVRNRPIWPLPQLVAWLDQRNIAPGTIGNLSVVFDFHTSQHVRLHELVRLIPADEPRVGWAASSTGEAELWRRGHRVRHVRNEDPAGDLRADGIRHVILSASQAERDGGATPQEWAARRDGVIVRELIVRHGGPLGRIDPHFLVRIKPAP